MPRATGTSAPTGVAWQRRALAMRFTTRVALSCAAISLALVPLRTPAAAKPRPISGKLSKAGYSVLAPAPGGQGRVTLVRASSDGRFSLRPPGGSVTRHLRAPDGNYAGPIVVGRKKKGRRDRRRQGGREARPGQDQRPQRLREAGAKAAAPLA